MRPRSRKCTQQHTRHPIYISPRLRRDGDGGNASKREISSAHQVAVTQVPCARQLSGGETAGSWSPSPLEDNIYAQRCSNRPVGLDSAQDVKEDNTYAKRCSNRPSQTRARVGDPPEVDGFGGTGVTTNWREAFSDGPTQSSSKGNATPQQQQQHTRHDITAILL